MQQLQKSERPHIAFFGCTNSGKSSLVNAITNQKLSIVSDVKGTTTDSVSKSMEILPLGPVVIIDTAGVNDLSELGEQRIQKTKEVLDKTDIAVLVIDSTVGENEFVTSSFKLLPNSTTGSPSIYSGIFICVQSLGNIFVIFIPSSISSYAK